MAKVEKYICDMCGAERKEANHWFTMLPLDRGYRFEVHRWPSGSAMLGGEHLCGEGCLQKFVSKWANNVPPTGVAPIFNKFRVRRSREPGVQGAHPTRK